MLQRTLTATLGQHCSAIYICHRATYVHAEDNFAKANVKVCNTNGRATTVLAHPQPNTMRKANLKEFAAARDTVGF